eukprot:jgi/Chlat1/386/Chrsp10S01500
MRSCFADKRRYCSANNRHSHLHARSAVQTLFHQPFNMGKPADPNHQDNSTVNASNSNTTIIKPRGWVGRVKSLEDYQNKWQQSMADPNAFWAKVAEDYHWHTPFQNRISIMTSISIGQKGRCLATGFGAERPTFATMHWTDTSRLARRGDKVAFLWEGNDPAHVRKLTYKELLASVCQIANFLKSKGVRPGHRVSIYMPMIPELPAAMLACARIGAVHSVVFAGFAAEALAERMRDSESSVLLTCSASARGNKTLHLKDIVDRAMQVASESGHEVRTCLVFDNADAVSRDRVKMKPGRDLWWQDAIASLPTECPVEWVDAEADLYMLYTSGSTGKPKGIVHAVGGYMVHAGHSYALAFDHREDDIFWSTADCGWITGHTYLAYGPLMNHATCVIFEGTPTWPKACWVVACLVMLDSLRILGSVGEPINPEAWSWYHSRIGRGRCPIVDTWWQTETGAAMLFPMPGAWKLKPGCATMPFFGVETVLLDEDGKEMQGAGTGVLAIKRAWPGMMKTIANDRARFEQTYFDAGKLRGYYLTGDGCRRDEDGYLWITGRVDDVINVSGHRVGTAEIEAALTSHKGCTEAAVVGFNHNRKGQGVYAYVVAAPEAEANDRLKAELRDVVKRVVGSFAVPDAIHFAPRGLPRTRSGKILRRMLRKIADGERDDLGDTSALADPTALEHLLKGGEKQGQQQHPRAKL